jgi:hypothetical protein
VFPVRYELNIYTLCRRKQVFKLGALKLNLKLNGRNISFINHVKYLSVMFDKRITWRLHIQVTEAKAFRTFIRIYSLFKSERLSVNITLNFYKALIRSVMTCLLRLGINGRRLHLTSQRLKNKVLCTIGNFPRYTPVRYFHTASNFPFAYDHITKLCRRQTEVIQNHENEHVRSIVQGEATYRKCKRLKLESGQAYDRSSD